MKNLVIVESPGKVKKIGEYLGSQYKVMSSYGHIRDLSKKDLGISEKGDTFDPVYEISDDKKELVKRLKSAAKEADMVWLASDEDREGEAIAWHLYEVLGLKPEKTRRIVFHEITKPAITHAIENPRGIDIDRVNAQQARRVLDRLVGFELSPVLWKKIKPALSAGRVQSVTLRLICEREKEVHEFKAESFYRIYAMFEADGKSFKAELPRRIETREEAKAFLQGCIGETFTVGEISVKPVKRSPQPPFTTSTLQQEASRKLGFSVANTMRVAQKLYEDGHITYMRTDSLNLSALAIKDISEHIKSTVGDTYYKERHYHTKSKGAQEAHEAIRPTYISHQTVDGTSEEKRLYDLIWRRTVASQMADAVMEKTIVEIERRDNPDRNDNFRAEGEVMKFDGFLKVYMSESSEKDVMLPRMGSGEILDIKEARGVERFTQPPARYTEGSLVKKMEELGIGRPSTYVPTISTIISRDYVHRGEKEGEKREYSVMELKDGKLTEGVQTENTGSEKGKLVPTDVGMIVNDFLTQYFPEILDYNFTAKVEEKFDEIAKGKLGWKDEITGFYGNFHPHIESINSMRMERKVGERVLGTDPKTGRPVSVKIGRYGPVVQIGEASDEERPLFASLQSGQSISDITLEEALKLFELPREVGEYEGKKMTAASGRFGPYIRFDGMFVSIPKTMDPKSITAEEAVSLIEDKRKKEAESHIKEFTEMPGLEVRKGRFGPYLAYKPEGVSKATNYKIPKTMDAEALTYEEACRLMEEQKDAVTKKSIKTTAKKTATKATSAKKGKTTTKETTTKKK